MKKYWLRMSPTERTLSLRKGSKYLLRLEPLDLDSETDNKADRDSEDKQSGEEGSIAASEEHLIDPSTSKNQPYISG
jgi:hypothetical protein